MPRFTRTFADGMQFYCPSCTYPAIPYCTIFPDPSLNISIFVNFKKSFLYGRIWRRPLGGGENIVFSKLLGNFFQRTQFGYSMCILWITFFRQLNVIKDLGCVFIIFEKSRSTLNSQPPHCK